MKHGKRIFASLIAVALLVVALSPASFGQSNRTKDRFGLHLGLLGDPFPTLIGFNADYNLTDWARLTAGYGSVKASVTGGDLTATTFGGGVRAMVPNWNFTPVVGLSFASVSVTATGTGVSGDVGGFSGSASHLYATFGLDYQAGIGFNVGAGYNFSLKSGVGGLPYVNLGWFF
ncbi:MAG TPA: hypothetical protein VI758_05305 [Bacteroidota bacterium]